MKISKAAQRVPQPNRTKMEQMASEVSAKIKLGTDPICSGLGKCCDIWAKFVGFSHPCFRNRLKPNETRKQRSPQSNAAGQDGGTPKTREVALVFVSGRAGEGGRVAEEACMLQCSVRCLKIPLKSSKSQTSTGALDRLLTGCLYSGRLRARTPQPNCKG